MKLKKIIIIPAVIILLMLVCIAAFLLVHVVKVNAGRERNNALLDRTSYPKLAAVGAVDRLSVIPLVDFYTDDANLKTEPGVSYLVKADDTMILLDVGFNREGTHPSALLHNMEALKIRPSDIGAVFITHLHPDHVGGMGEVSRGEFSLSQGPVELGTVPVYSPGLIKPSHWNSRPMVQVVKEPVVIGPGVASLGTIPRQLFIMGKTDEQVLAVNLRGKGIVLIIGCGHPTVERIIQRAAMIFNEPIYAIIGGLHFPVKGGRGNIGPLNIQYLLGADRAPWNGLNEADVDHAITAIRNAKIRVIALSPHDSSDWSLDRFKKAFPQEWVDLKVGREIHL